MAEFVNRRGIDFSAVHVLRRSPANGDFPLEVAPVGDLRPGRNSPAHNAGVAINDSNAASVEVGFFVKVRGKYGIPKTKCPAESVRPRPGHIDLDPDIPDDRFSQVIIIRARRLRTCPVRSRLSENTAK